MTTENVVSMTGIATHAEMHGRCGLRSWKAPIRVTFCDVEARPGYASTKAHEYNDTRPVLQAKVKMLGRMIRQVKTRVYLCMWLHHVFAGVR